MFELKKQNKTKASALSEIEAFVQTSICKLCVISYYDRAYDRFYVPWYCLGAVLKVGGWCHAFLLVLSCTVEDGVIRARSVRRYFMSSRNYFEAQSITEHHITG